LKERPVSYTNDQLASLVTAPESAGLERKASFSDKDKICKTLCAFANDLANTRKPGLLWLGIADDGRVIGVDATDTLLQKIDQIKSEGKIQPLPSLTVRQIMYEGKTLIALVVAPSSLPPVAYDGRIWVRMAASTQLASKEDERLLAERRRATGGRSFDSEGVPQASLRDLNRPYFESTYLPQAVAQDMLDANGRTWEERLVATRMAIGMEPVIPTVAGLLTTALSPQDWLAGAYVQFIRYAGTEHGGDIVDEKRITGNLEDVINGTEAIFKAHIQTAVHITGQDRERRQADYPLSALQQLFRNAILHRNYEGTNAPVRVYWFDDRIEIANPGGPYGAVTVDNFGKPYATDYRNPVVAEVLFNLKFVQKFGFGIQNARKLLADNGNGEPRFEPSQTMVVVTIPRVQA
jgi:ATP-dependent DNA helicase RecG